AEELLAGLHVLAELDRAIADDARERRDDARVLEIEPRARDVGLGRLDRRLARGDGRFADAELVRRVAVGLAGAALRLFEARLLLLDGLLGRVGERARRVDLGARRLGGGEIGVVALLRNGALGEEILVAREIGVGARLIGGGGLHARQRRLVLALGGDDGGARAGDVVAGGGDLRD